MSGVCIDDAGVGEYNLKVDDTVCGPPYLRSKVIDTAPEKKTRNTDRLVTSTNDGTAVGCDPAVNINPSIAGSEGSSRFLVIEKFKLVESVG